MTFKYIYIYSYYDEISDHIYQMILKNIIFYILYYTYYTILIFSVYIYISDCILYISKFMYVNASGAFVLSIPREHIYTPFAPRQDEMDIHFTHC